MFTVGIDLGTTATVVAMIENGKPVTIMTDSGKKTTPSVVLYNRDEDHGGNVSAVVGRAALSKLDYGHTVFSVKRSMGSDKKFFEKTPEEISADILLFAKSSAERKTGQAIDAAVITVPAHFSDIQRTATKRAASLSGLKVLRLINEPTAAAIAFGLEKEVNGIYAVYDFGGGTFDFSVLRLSDGIFQVLATGGDNYLGGDDIDNEILKKNLIACNIDAHQLTNSEWLTAKLIVKNMKEQLNDSEIIEKKFIYHGYEYNFQLTQAFLEDASKKCIDRTFQIADQVLNDAKKPKIDGVLLVGGMTKVQIVKNAVKSHFKVRIFSDIDPEEVVAFGAAIQADNIARKNANTLLIDVVPLTLGIETFGGGVDRIIYRNTPIPTKQTREYTTYADNQKGIKFHVVQGERPLAEDCRSIANFELTGIPPAMKGTPRVSVDFSVDVNGILSISAREKNTGIEQNVIVEPSSGLSEEKMVAMLESAVENFSEDKEKAAYLSMKMAAERQIAFWESIIDEIPTLERAEISKGIDLLKNSIDKISSKEISDLINRLDDIVGQFLDDIISKRLSRNPIKISERS